MIKNMAELVMKIDLCDKDIQLIKRRISLSSDNEFLVGYVDELTKALNSEIRYRENLSKELKCLEIDNLVNTYIEFGLSEMIKEKESEIIEARKQMSLVGNTWSDTKKLSWIKCHKKEINDLIEQLDTYNEALDRIKLTK